MADDPLATPADLANYLGITIAEEDERALFLLDAASALVRSYTEQFLSEVADDEISLPGNGREVLLLPQIPVTEVSEVVVDEETLVVDEDYIWDATGRLIKIGGEWPVTWTKGFAVAVTYTHGYAEVPADIVLAVCRIAGAMWSSPIASGPVESETIGDYSYKLGGAGAGQSALQEERSILNHYRIVSVA